MNAVKTTEMHISCFFEEKLCNFDSSYNSSYFLVADGRIHPDESYHPIHHGLTEKRLTLSMMRFTSKQVLELNLDSNPMV